MEIWPYGFNITESPRLPLGGPSFGRCDVFFKGILASFFLGTGKGHVGRENNSNIMRGFVCLITINGFLLIIEVTRNIVKVAAMYLINAKLHLTLLRSIIHPIQSLPRRHTIHSCRPNILSLGLDPVAQ
jgi:hypothetical protein